MTRQPSPQRHFNPITAPDARTNEAPHSPDSRDLVERDAWRGPWGLGGCLLLALGAVAATLVSSIIGAP